MKVPAKLVPMLVILLLAIAFLLGRYQGQVELLKGGDAGSGNKQAAEQGAQPTGTAGQNQNTGKLTGEQWDNLLSTSVYKKGSDKALVTIVEFTDYQCPYCGRYVKETLNQIQTQYIDTGKVNYILRDLVLPFHANAESAAEAARCAGDQGKYWEMHDLIFEDQEAWSSGDPQETFIGYAKSLGLKTADFTVCYTNKKYNEEIAADVNLGQQLGVNGTPSFFINGELVVGALPFASFQEKIEAALK